jgi:hypothetical protein
MKPHSTTGLWRCGVAIWRNLQLTAPTLFRCQPGVDVLGA